MPCSPFDKCRSNQPTKPTNPCIQSLWRAHQWAVRALANAKLAPPAALTAVLPCSSHSAVRSSLQGGFAPQAHYYHSSAAVSVPFRRLPTLARYGEPLLSPHWFDRASTFGLGTVKQCPAHVPYTLLSFPKPSAFHSHAALASPQSVQVSSPPH